MAPGGRRLPWRGAEDLLAVSREAHVRQQAGNNTDCDLCTLLFIVGTVPRVPTPGNLLSAWHTRWVAAMVLNRDMGPILRLPSLGELPAAARGALPAPRALLVVADLWHQTGLPDARLQHALLCLAAAPGGDVARHVVVLAVHRSRAREVEAAHTPCVGGECPAVGADGGRGAHPRCRLAGHGTCGGSGGHRVLGLCSAGTGGHRLGRGHCGRRQLLRTASFRVLWDHLQLLGPVCRARRCSPDGIQPASPVFVALTTEPRIPG